jgi:hypothetical protein
MAHLNARMSLGRSVLLKVYTTTDGRHPHKHCRWQELKAGVLAQPPA